MSGGSKTPSGSSSPSRDPTIHCTELATQMRLQEVILVIKKGRRVPVFDDGNHRHELFVRLSLNSFTFRLCQVKWCESVLHALPSQTDQTTTLTSFGT